MQKEHHILGYTEFEPEKAIVIYGDEQRSLHGNRTIIRREETDIVWVRETGASAYLTFKGRIVKNLAAYNDFYGLASSADTLAEETPRFAKSWKIDLESELELHAVAWIEDKPTLGYATSEYGRRYYKPMPSHVWFDHPEAKVGEVLNSENFPFNSAVRLEAVKHSASIIWKSSRTPEENASAFAAYMELAKATERTVLQTGVEIPD